MYLSYYNLKVKPFQMSTDPDFLWLGEKHKEALAVLKYAIMENKGVLALTGDVGTGKTTLINALLKSLGKDTITATVYDARLEVLDFFHTVAAAFKIKRTFEGKGQFILGFMDFLIKAHERHQKVLLIIDEAQGINEDLLEEIRLLSNLEAEYTRLLNIFFVGQNEFIDILQKYENRALRQRVTIRYHINPLTLNETAAYIRHRLEVSGTTDLIFDSGAIDEIFFFSGGYPRLINIMCDHALLTGFVREVQTINANLIRECREELLVSKKSSGEDFEFPAGNQQVLSREPMDSVPSREPMGPAPPRKPVASGPSREPMASDLSREIMDYVKESHVLEDDQDSFGPRYPMYEPAVPRKIQKKRFFGFRSILIFLLVAGAGYFFYGKYHNHTRSSVATVRPPSNKHFSMNEKSENNHPSATQAQPDASDIPNQVQPEKSEDSRFPVIDPSKSDMSKAAVPKETESYQLGPSNTYSQDADAAAFSKKPPEKMQDSVQTIEKIPLKPLTVASAPSNLTAEAPVAIPAPTTKKGGIQATPSEPAQVRATAKSAKSAQKALLKPVEKSETAESTTGSVRERNNAKEPETLIREAPKKDLEVASSVSSEKKTTALFEKFRESLSKKTVVSDAAKPVNPPTTVKEKPPAAVSTSDRKKLMSQNAANRSDQGAGEKIASLGIPANKSEKTGKTYLPYIPLTTRLESFLKKYCRTYEQKNIDKFSDFFTLNAVEKGKPFKSWLSTYRRNFKRIDSIEYNIDLNRYATQEDTGLVKIDGTFHIRARLEGSKEWLKSSGDISMILEADGNSFKVKQLDY
jgi:type II secretory pathway predicted ATPase ExeA